MSHLMYVFFTVMMCHGLGDLRSMSVGHSTGVLSMEGSNISNLALLILRLVGLMMNCCLFLMASYDECAFFGFACWFNWCLAGTLGLQVGKELNGSVIFMYRSSLFRL